MIIKKRFWYREKGSIRTASTYDNPLNVDKFVKKWGGKALDELRVTDGVAALIGDREICTLISNGEPLDEPVGGEFQVYDPHFHSAYATVGQANAVAKELAQFRTLVFVVRERAGGAVAQEIQF